MHHTPQTQVTQAQAQTQRNQKGKLYPRQKLEINNFSELFSACLLQRHIDLTFIIFFIIVFLFSLFLFYFPFNWRSTRLRSAFLICNFFLVACFVAELQRGV